MTARAVGVVGCAAGGLEDLRPCLVEPLMSQGWQVGVTLTPTAETWLRASGELGRLEDATGLPVRSTPLLPGEDRPHPPVSCYVVAPASANFVAKLALGIADNQALTQVGEALGTTGLDVVLFPRVNAAHARHPSWESHLEKLSKVGVYLVYGDDVWPLHEPRSAPAKALPWHAILEVVARLV